MSDSDQKKQDGGKVSVNPVAAAVTGAVVGAGIAVAGVVALEDEKNREKAKETLIHVKDQVVGYIENMQKHTQEKKDKTAIKPSGKPKKVKKEAAAAKKSNRRNVKKPAGS
jgi:hypothetical protein